MGKLPSTGSFRNMIAAVWGWVCLLFAATPLLGQDCLEPCECHPLTEVFAVEASSASGCAPLSIDLALALDSAEIAGYAFDWSITGGPYSWTAGTNATFAAPSIVLESSAVYEIEATVTDTAGTGCAGSSQVLLVSVAGSPEVLVSDAPELCAWEEGVVQVLVNPGNTSLTSFAWGVGGTWDTLAFPAPLTHVFDSAGANEVIAWAENACGFDADTTFVTVYPTPAIDVASDFNWYCMGSYADFTATGEGDFVWNANAELLSGGQPGDSTARYATGSQVVGSVYTTINHGNVQCTSSAGFTVYGFFVPSVAIAADGFACVGDEVPLQGNITSYGWDTSVEWIVDGTPIDTAWAPTASVSATSTTAWEGDSVPGLHEIEAVVTFDPYPGWLADYGCRDTASHVVEIVSLPEVSLPSAWTVCNQPILEPLPAAAPVGGVWQYQGAPLGNAIDPSSFGIGSHELTYAFVDVHGCAASDTTVMSVEEPVWAHAGLDTAFCESNDLFGLPIADEGGYWTGPGILDSGMGTLDLGELEVGNNALVYALGTGSCATQDTAIWEVWEEPVAFLSTEGGLVCDGDTVWMELFAGGGTLAPGSEYTLEWTDDVVFDEGGFPYIMATFNSPFLIVGVTVSDDLGCADDAMTFISPLPLPDVEVPALEPTCAQDIPIELPTAWPLNGEWSGPGIVDPTGMFNPSLAGTGSIELTYSASNVAGCINSGTATMQVTEPPFIDAGLSASACEGADAPAVEGFQPDLGWWEGPVTAQGDSAVFVAGDLGPGVHPAVYHVGTESCHVSDTTFLTIHANPILGTNSTLQVCTGDTASAVVNVLNAAELDGFSFAWSGDSLLPTAEPNEVATGPWSAEDVPTVSVVVANAEGCESALDLAWTVHSLPVISLTDSMAVCADEAQPVELPEAQPVGGLWIGAGVAGETFDAGLAGIGEALVEYAYTDGQGCTASDTLVVEVVEPAVLDLGPKLHACESAGLVALPSPALEGTWSGHGLVGAQAETVDVGLLAPGVHVFEFTHLGAPCTVSAELELEVHPDPIVQLVSVPTVCADSALAMTVDAVGTSVPVSWNWTVDGAAVEGDSTTLDFIWSTGGVHAVEVSATDDWGCSATLTFDASVELPVPVALSSVISVCNQAIPVDLSAEATPPGPGVETFEGLGAIGEAVTAAGQLNPGLLDIGAHQVAYHFAPDSGCPFRDTLTVAVESPYQVQAGQDTTACFGSGLLAFNVLNGSLPVEWSYASADPANAVANSELGIIDVAELTVGSHAFAVLGGEGSCATSDTVAVEVFALPEIQLPSMANTCTNTPSLELGDVLPPGGTWSGPGVDGAQGVFQPSLAGAGEFTLQYAYTDPGTGCSSDAAVDVAVQAPIQPELDAPSLVCVGAEVAFAVANAVDFDSIAWWVESTLLSTSDSLNWTPTATGAGQGAIIAIDVNGCVDTTQVNWTASAVPEVNLIQSEAQGCAPLDLVFSADGPLDDVDLQWSVNGAPAGSASELMATLTADDSAQLHTVALEVVHACGTTTLLEEVLVEPSPVIDFENAVSDVCAGESAVLTWGAAYADVLTWSDANGDPGSGDSIAFAADGLGSLEFEVFALNAQTGCTAEATWQVQVHGAPNIEVAVSTPAGCSPLEVTFTASSASELSNWAWTQNGDADTLGGAVFPGWFDEPGVHAVHVVAEDIHGCIGEATGVVEVLPTPDVDWSLASDQWCGLPAEIPVTLPGEGGAVHWNVNGELAAIGDSAVLSMSSFGWQFIEAVVTNGVGCSRTVLDSLETLPLPQAQLTAEPAVGCSPLEVQLAFDFGNAEASMSWVSEEEVVLLPQLDSLITFSEPGAYQVKLDLVDNRGCENTVMLGDSIQVLPSPEVEFEPNPYAGTWDNPDPLNSTWSFENLSDAGQALWDFGDGGMSTIWNGTHTYEAPGTYTVHVMVVNEVGCAGEAMMEVEVLENLQVFVPNAFTPPTNGYSDGVNDGWRPEVSEPDLVDSYWLRVFNRYGQLIWETFDPEEHWIGEAQRGGEFFGMNDAYTWVLRIESRAQRPAQREWRGHVTLIR